jgi:PAS domain S-box-containing protein
MFMVNRSPLLRYSIAIACVLLATLLRFLLSPLLEHSAPFVTYILAVLITAWACGLGPALLAICLGAIGGAFFFIPPQVSLNINGTANTIGLVLYLSISTVGTLLSHEMHRARRRAEANAQTTRERQAELEQQMAELKKAEEAISFQAHLLDTVEQAVIATDLGGKIIYWNRFAETVYGWSAAEAVGRNIIEVTPADSTQEEAAEIMSRLQKGQSWSGELMVRRQDGTNFPAMITDTPIYDDERKIIGVVGVSIDITERKRAEAALHAAEQHAIIEYEHLLERLSPLAEALGTARDLHTIYRALLDFALSSMPCIGIFIALYDPLKNVRTAAYAWGDGEEVDVSNLPPMPISTDGPNSRAVKTGEIIITDDYLAATRGHPSVKVGVDNGLLPQSSMAAPMAVMGRIVGTVEVQSYQLAAFKPEHVTAMRMAANLAAVAIENLRLFELESNARASAEASNRLKDEFLATLSHELRTPLTAVLGWLSLLRSGKLDEDTQQQALATIERNANAQAQLIEDILDVSRIITGQLRLDVRPFDFSEVIDSAIASVRPAAEAKQIRIETMIDRQASLVWGDAVRLQQVVWNLISNAVKFTPREGRITIQLESDNSHTKIVVRDTGQGINPEFLPYVFDRFRQADSTSTRTHSGLGLGLAIVRHLVEMHGGQVRAESEGVGRGASFTLELPVRSERSEMGQEVVAYQSGEEATGLDRPTLLKDISVLVVDDEPDTRALLRHALEQCGARVTTAANASEALAVLKKMRPDVLLSDIGMPGEDGYDLIRRVRALEPERGGRLPAIALTAYVGADDRQRAISAGYHAHVGKPVELTKLATLVARLAGRNGEHKSDGKAQES